MNRINIALLMAVLIASLLMSVAYGFTESSNGYESGIYSQHGAYQY